MLCEKCGSPLVKRVNSYTGEEFLGCSAFPKCRYSVQNRSAYYKFDNVGVVCTDEIDSDGSPMWIDELREY